MAKKTYLITGGSGFIGSHLTRLLLSEGEKVVALDNLSTGNLSNIEPFLENPNYQFVRADIQDEIVLDRLTSQAQVVVHLAAAVGVKLIVEKPVHTIETNISGTEAVLKAAVRYRCRVLIASTSEVYGKGSKIPFSEEDDVLLGPTSKSRWAYAASKMVDEFLGLAYHHEFGLDVAVVRLFNTVGPGQVSHYGMVIPTLIRQALRGEALTIYGDGLQSRCFCDVRDVVKALAGLTRHPDASGRVYNIGGTEEITIRDLAQRVKAATLSDSPLVYVPYSQAYAPGFEDMRRRVPNTGRIQALLNWEPTWKLEDTLLAVAEHEKAKQKPAPSSNGNADRKVVLEPAIQAVN